MKLMTKQLEKRFDEIGSQENCADPTVIAKYFLAGSSGTWYATEYNPEDRIFFGYVTGLAHDEWGYFSLDELESVRSSHFNLPFERDLHCGEKKLSEHYPQITDEIKRRRELRDLEKSQEREIDNDLDR